MLTEATMRPIYLLTFTAIAACSGENPIEPPPAPPPSYTWSTKAPMPQIRDLLGVGVAGGRLYAVGGSDGVAVAGTVMAYNPATSSLGSLHSTTELLPQMQH